MSVRITCIKKFGGYLENPHEAIGIFGWTNENNQQAAKTHREAMWQWVTDGGVAYVKDAYGNVAYVVAKTNSRGTRYLQTVSDQTPTDNLLKLPECE
jgi:hypothetical protein